MQSMTCNKTTLQKSADRLGSLEAVSAKTKKLKLYTYNIKNHASNILNQLVLGKLCHNALT